MNGVKVSSERFKSMLSEKGISAYALARQIGSTDYQMWRLKSGTQTTSFRFLEKLIPVFGLVAVADIITDEEQNAAFTWQHVAALRAAHATKRKTA